MIRFCRQYSDFKARPAFTLGELLLVMAVLIIVIGVTTPSINRMFQRQALDRGADRLRAAMGKARISAIKNGDVYAVFISRGGNWYDVGPYANSQTQIARAQRDVAFVERQGNSSFEDNMLPRGVSFASSDAASDSRSEELIAEYGAQGNGLQQVLFYPDGTSQDASVIVQNESGGLIEVQLRGLTGISKSVRLKQRRAR